MRELYLSELRRFRKAALIAAPLHLLALFLMLRFFDFMHMYLHSQLLLLFIYLMLAFGFGLYQFGSYRQPNRWIWLMHRPLPASHIGMAICGASATLIGAVLCLPGLLALAGTQLLTTRVVDTYHYFVVLHGSLFALAAWLCAGYVMLNRSKLGASIVLLPFLLMFRITSVYQLLLLDAICIALLAAMVCTAMRPNRHAPPQGTAAVLATALPLLLASYFLLAAGGSLVYQYAAILHGSHPLNTEIPPERGYTEAVRSDPSRRMQLGLAGSRHPRAVEGRAALDKLTLSQHFPNFDGYPIRNQIGPSERHDFSDDKNKLEWTYSQDAGAFIGRNLYSGERKASLPAPSLPHLPFLKSVDVEAVFPHRAVVYDPASKSWHEQLRVRDDEILLTMPEIGSPRRQYLVTSKRLVAMEAGAAPREVYGIPLPGPAAELSFVDVAELADGALASFLFGKRMIDGVPGGEQLVLFIDQQGHATEVARRPLSHDFPVLFEHKDWWISPLLQAVDALPRILFANPNVFPPIPLDLPRPPAAWYALLASTLLSIAAGYWWLRRTEASARRRAGWLAACAVFGPSAFVSLAVMERRTVSLPNVVARNAASAA